MAHDDDCATCRRLDEAEVEVRVHGADDPNIRRFTAHPWPAEPAEYTTAEAADAHPLARALWRNGTVRIVFDDQGAVVERADPRAWPFYAEGMATSLAEQIALLTG